MASTIDSALFGDVWSTAEMRAVWSDETMVQRWLDVEAALARAEARLGIIPAAHAEEITRNARVELLDLAEMKRQLDHTRHPIVPLIRVLQRVCEPAAGESIHWGATTQDIMDTGLVLQLKAADAIVRRDLGRIAAILADLAQRHKHTVQVGRTHGQQALPITFGYKVAVWVAEVRRHLSRLEQMAPRVFRGQFGGAVGTLASIGPRGFELQQVMFANLGLAVPDITWHTARDGMAELVCVYAMIGSTLAKIADEVIGLQRTEVAEVEEPFHMGKVGSSTMPHKRNPSMCEGVVALARVLQAQVAPALAGMLAYNERDKRGNLAEGAFLAETCCLLSGILATMLRVLDGLQVYPEAMTQNLDRLRGLLLSENVMLALGRKIGRQHAHEILYEICMRSVQEQAPLKSLLLTDPRVAEHLGEPEVDELLDPTRYTGLAAEMVDRMTPPADASAPPR
jgi:3-carboxy-cis,cis-muconate cycloisomerase